MMYNKTPNEELPTEELLCRLLNYHSNLVIINYKSDNKTYELREAEELYDECLKEMMKRIKNEKI